MGFDVVLVFAFLALLKRIAILIKNCGNSREKYKREWSEEWRDGAKNGGTLYILGKELGPFLRIIWKVFGSQGGTVIIGNPTIYPLYL